MRLSAVPAGVRPMSDRAREGLFSSLGERVEGARALDLFAGTGALGIEALSRGASEAGFVDRDPRAIAAIEGNLGRAGLADRAWTRRSDVGRFLTKTRNPSPVDVCFVDPPYAMAPSAVARVLEAIAARWLPEHGWIVALTRPKRSSTLVIPVDWSVARRLVYGDSLVICYRKE
jgi:16S rRNA (guanine966-N2)-methyltransferase